MSSGLTRKSSAAQHLEAKGVNKPQRASKVLGRLQRLVRSWAGKLAQNRASICERGSGATPESRKTLSSLERTSESRQIRNHLGIGRNNWPPIAEGERDIRPQSSEGYMRQMIRILNSFEQLHQ